jgi:hypothetical protein
MITMDTSMLAIGAPQAGYYPSRNYHVIFLSIRNKNFSTSTTMPFDRSDWLGQSDCLHLTLAALASAAPRPLGSLFRQLFTTQSALRG